MAGPYYLRSTDGAAGSDGLSWANAKASIEDLDAVMAPGERCWVSPAHNELVGAVLTINSPGTLAAPCEVFCGNDAAQPPTALSSGAVMAASGSFAIRFTGGYCNWYGITFNAGTGNTATMLEVCYTGAEAAHTFENCAFNIVSTGASANRVRFGTGNPSTANQYVMLKNCTISFGNATNRLAVNAHFEMQGGSICATGVIPALLILPWAGGGSTTRFRGVDLSAISTALVDTSLTGMNTYEFQNCRLHPSVAITTGGHCGPGGPVVILDNCDSADTNYRMRVSRGEGDLYSETTIVRTGGATHGTTPIAHRMVPSAGRTFYMPLYGRELVAWNDVLGSARKAAVQIVHDSATPLTDKEVWLELEYPGTAASSRSTFASDSSATVIATPANQPTSSAAWTTTGLTTPNKQVLEVTVTAAEAGWFRGRVACAKSGYTVYYDPELTIS